MTGPEHYREAERLLDESQTVPSFNDETNPGADRMIAEAHVHATLALATALLALSAVARGGAS